MLYYDNQMFEDVKFLKERAKEFWEEALRDLKEAKYNLAAFHLEQAVQLYIKYLLAKELGEWPRTHYLSELLEKLNEVYENKKIKEFQKENELFFENLTDAYFTSRYYPRTFSESLVKKLKSYSEKFFILIKKELKDDFLE